jgi:hypothetical protein
LNLSDWRLLFLDFVAEDVGVVGKEELDQRCWNVESRREHDGN